MAGESSVAAEEFTNKWDAEQTAQFIKMSAENDHLFTGAKYWSMDDLCEFLKSRNVTDDIIQQMQQDKIDCSVILLMTDDQLKEYLPSYGDRLAVRGYCRRKEDPSGRKSKPFDRLSTRLASSIGYTNNACEKTMSKNSQKSTRKIEMGWMHFREGKFTQVRTKKGGGTRRISVSKNWRKKDLLEKATELFFPDVKYFVGSFTDFEVDVTDFQGQTIDDQITVGELYELTKAPILRFYLTTKKKVIDSDTQSDIQFNFKIETVEQGVENTQDSPLLTENEEPYPNYVRSSALFATGSAVLLSDSITSMTEVDAARQPEVDNLEDSGTVTISTGLISGLENNLPLAGEPYSVPSPIDNSLEPFIQTERGKKTLVLHRGQALGQLIAHFCDESILVDGISIKVILPNGRLENAVDEGGF